MQLDEIARLTVTGIGGKVDRPGGRVGRTAWMDRPSGHASP